jgi:hypothetical protein
LEWAGHTWISLQEVFKDQGVPRDSISGLPNPRLLWFEYGWFPSKLVLMLNPSAGEDIFKR